MKKILVVDTTWPINSRTERFKNSLKSTFNVIVVAWNRGSRVTKIPESTYLLESELGYGNQIKKLLYLPKFAWHLYRSCQKEKPQIIFASHWDSLFCAIFVKTLLRKHKIKLVYDCLDMPTFSNKIIFRLVNLIEKKALKFVDLTIFASRYFKELYPVDIKSLVFENYPSSSLLGSKEMLPTWLENYDIDKLKQINNIAWIGVVRYFNIINNILLAIKDTNICFFIFGDGPDIDKVKCAVDNYGLADRVIFFGRYAPADLRYIYKLSGLVWAAYPTLDFNAVYAISNKYFECSFFEKRIILSKNTKMAENLQKTPSVVLVNEYDPSNIKENILSSISMPSYMYEKYEPDISWEEKEEEFIRAMNHVIVNHSIR